MTQNLGKNHNIGQLFIYPIQYFIAHKSSIVVEATKFVHQKWNLVEERSIEEEKIINIINDMDDTKFKESSFHECTKLVMYLHQAIETCEWTFCLSEKVHEFSESHINFCDPFKKLHAMGLPSPWKGDTFIESSELMEEMTKEQDNNRSFLE